jgi:uncharacterized MAPEG superfamily protein
MMMTTVQALVWSAILTFVIVLVASACCARVWEPGGIATAFGNREGMPPATGLAGRADRAAKNQIEAMVMFLAAVLATSIAGKTPQAALGATIFFWARLVYWPVYLAGITYLRTLIWFVSIFGLIAILIETW